MFSDHLPHIDKTSGRNLFVVAGALVIICQVVAMVMVAGGQVEKAQLREASQASARAATAGCIESSWGAALRDCDRTVSSFSPQASSDQTMPTAQGIKLVTLDYRY